MKSVPQPWDWFKLQPPSMTPWPASSYAWPEGVMPSWTTGSPTGMGWSITAALLASIVLSQSNWIRPTLFSVAGLCQVKKSFIYVQWNPESLCWWRLCPPPPSHLYSWISNWGWILPVRPAIAAPGPIPWQHGHALLGLCGACYILNPHVQVSTFQPLGAGPVTDRDTFPKFGLGSMFPRKRMLIFFISFS